MRPVINAAGHLSSLGGSTMAPVVRSAVSEMAGRYVDIVELFLSAETEIADLTHNENAVITSGASAAIVTTVLAAACQGNPNTAEALLESHTPIRIAIHFDHWTPVNRGLRLLGVDVRCVMLDQSATVSELAAALDGVAITIVLADWELSARAPTLSTWVSAARLVGCPIILDAAAELPPVDNLWRFTRELGFDAVIFSGGKDLGGPPGVGFLVGKSPLLNTCKSLRFPMVSVLRPLKVGKEQVAGLTSALRHYLNLDHEQRRNVAESILVDWKFALDKAGLRTQLTHDPRSGIALWLDVGWQSDTGLPSAEIVQNRLWADTPGVATSLSPARELRLTSWCLSQHESECVLASLLRHIS